MMWNVQQEQIVREIPFALVINAGKNSVSKIVIATLSLPGAMSIMVYVI